MGELQVVLAWAAFCAFHSLTVSVPYERAARRVLGDASFDGYHRLIFTAYSCVALLCVLLFLRTLPDRPFFRIDGPLRHVFHALQGAGIVLLAWTPWDIREFLGIRQWLRHRRSPRGECAADRPVPRLFTGRAYAVVRHPLYLGCSLVLAFRPAQSRNGFLSAATIILYFYAGSFLEERRLHATFGDAYRDYCRRVPRFLPLPRPHTAALKG